MKLHVRSLMRVICAVGVITSATGCIDASTNIIVNKDGSGRIVETVYISKQFEQTMKQMMAGSGATQSPLNFDKKDARQKATELGQGVKFVSHKKVSRADGASGSKTTYSFEDIEKIKLSLDSGLPAQDKQPGMGMQAPGGQKKDKSKPVTFKFKPGSKAELVVNMPREEKETSDTKHAPPGKEHEMNPQQMAMMKQMFAGFRIRMQIGVNGAITKTTAAHVEKDGKTDHVTLFDMDIGKMLKNGESFKKLQNMGKMKNVQEAMKRLRDIEGIKVEPSEQIKVVFK